MSDVTLRDPELCPSCQADSRVVDSRKRPTFRWRQRKCVVCKRTWPTYETLLHPNRIRSRPRL